MLAMPAAEPFASRDYVFDVAWDGVRALASIDGGQVQRSLQTVGHSVERIWWLGPLRGESYTLSSSQRIEHRAPEGSTRQEAVKARPDRPAIPGNRSFGASVEVEGRAGAASEAAAGTG